MPPPAVPVNDTLLEVRNLCVNFGAFAALSDVSFGLRAGETLGLVGESGSGKSTLARALLRLIPAVRGTVIWRGVDLLSCDAATMRRQRRDLQMIFQDPLASLNPRMTVGEALAEPLAIFEPTLPARTRQSRIDEMLERVGLTHGAVDRYPHAFSGGQCQRIGIARAMMLRPKLLVCDEPVSSLDVSIQGQIVNLLMDLQQEFGTAVLFISHNLAVVRHISHRVLVIYLGRIVEDAARDALFAAPAHPYTRALLAAVPDPTRALAGAPGVAEQNADAAGEPPRGNAIPSGCAFRGRCRYAEAICELRVPQLEQVSAEHAVACHRWRALARSPGPTPSAVHDTRPA
jgi:oligopeptide transport system ATP-binding protein